MRCLCVVFWGVPGAVAADLTRLSPRARHAHMSRVAAALLGDETQIFIKTMGLVGIGVAAPTVAPLFAAPLAPILLG